MEKQKRQRGKINNNNKTQKMSEVIKIALVDDESLFLEGLSLIFSNVKHINLIKESGSGIEFLEFLEKIPEIDLPNIVLVDIQMKPMDGFKLVELLKNKYQNLKIIVLSSHYKSNVVGHMIKLGVSAFIPKNANKEVLINTIDSVYKFGIYFNLEDQKLLMSYMKKKISRPTFNAIENLSVREIEVLKLICKELTNQEIANVLFLSKRTIESHRQRILEKVGAKNTVGLVIYAIINRVHDIPDFTHPV